MVPLEVVLLVEAVVVVFVLAVVLEVEALGPEEAMPTLAVVVLLVDEVPPEMLLPPQPTQPTEQTEPPPSRPRRRVRTTISSPSSSL